jgi:WD40 repeat protein
MSFSSVAVGSILATRKKGTGPVSGEDGRPNDAVRQHVQAGRDTYAAGRDLTINRYGQEPAARRGQPEVDSWVATIYLSPQGGSPVGSGVVIAERRVLTCAHVVMKDGAALDEVWVAFPMADPPVAARRRVSSVITPGDGSFDEDQDVAILELADPIPTGVTPARLRCPTPESLAGTKWWALGFPPGQRRGSASEGEVGAALAAGWVRIDVTSAYPIEPGFSGTGLWSPEFGAVVGIIAVYDEHRNGQALTIHQAAHCLPGHGLRELAEESRATDSGEIALTAWGWTLATDPEGRRHWRPRGRGVAIDSERGYRFRGRTAALTAIKAWLDRDTPDRKTLVVTGNPGSGKSAVLGRIVTTADKDAAAQLPADDTAMRATEGSVACAVHAKGATALEIARQIAKAASAQIPDRLDDFPTALHDALTERNAPRFNLILDALDESPEPRTVIDKVILPAAETCPGAQVVLGTRRTDGDGDILAAFGGAATVIDLDTEQYFAREDLVAYTLATLQRAGDARDRNPYATSEFAHPLAERIAQLSHPNFLVAGLTAKTHGLYDETPVAPGELSFSPRVDDAMREYLKRVPKVSGVSAETLLLPLAYAESPGLPVSLWRVALSALGASDVSEAALKRFARSSAASFLVQSADPGGEGTAFRLFHQALNDALVHARAQVAESRDDERAITTAFLAAGRENGWSTAPAYLLRGLAAHAARAGLLDTLLADDTYLLHADLLRVQPLADKATTKAGRQRARLLRLSPRDTVSADAPNRAAMFSVTEALAGLPTAYTHAAVRAPYRAAWVAAPLSAEHLVLRGHDREVTRVCAFTHDGRAYLATAGEEPGIRIWDLATGTQQRTLDQGYQRVNTMCAFTLNRQPRLAVAGFNTVTIWDPVTGVRHQQLHGHTSLINDICAFTLNGIALLATAGADKTTRIWDPATGTRQHQFAHRDKAYAVCAFTLDETTLLAVGTETAIEIWDTTGRQRSRLGRLTHWPTAICPVSLDDTTLLATIDGNDAVSLWDPADGRLEREFHAHTPSPRYVKAICAFSDNRRPRIATGGADRTVRVWDPATGTQQHEFHGHLDLVTDICAYVHDGTGHLATASADGSVRIWDSVTGTRENARNDFTSRMLSVYPFTHDGHARLATLSEERATAANRTVRVWDAANGTQQCELPHADEVSAVCAYSDNGQTRLATAGSDWFVRTWDPATGTQQHGFRTHTDDPTAICAYTHNGTTYLAIAGDWAIGILDATTGTPQGQLHRPASPVRAICPVTLNGIPHLAAGDGDGIVRVWNPARGTHFTLKRHRGAVTSICAFPGNGVPHLATGSRDKTVGIWNPTKGTPLRTLAGHSDAILSITAIALDDTTLLATASDDHTVRIWDPAKDASLLVIPIRDRPSSVAYANGLLFVGMATGLMAIRLDLVILGGAAIDMVPGSPSRAAWPLRS